MTVSPKKNGVDSWRRRFLSGSLSPAQFGVSLCVGVDETFSGDGDAGEAPLVGHVAQVAVDGDGVQAGAEGFARARYGEGLLAAGAAVVHRGEFAGVDAFGEFGGQDSRCGAQPALPSRVTQRAATRPTMTRRPAADRRVVAVTTVRVSRTWTVVSAGPAHDNAERGHKAFGPPAPRPVRGNGCHGRISGPVDKG